MEGDFETKYLREMAKVEKLTKEVNNLKSNLTKLSNRVATLEFQGFQDQITSLNDKVEATNKRIMELVHLYNMLEKMVLTNKLYTWVSSIFDVLKDEYRNNLKTELMLDCTNARDRILMGKTNPLDVFNKFKKVWTERLDKEGVKFISF